jgi:hypothetical protein
MTWSPPEFQIGTLEELFICQVVSVPKGTPLSTISVVFALRSLGLPRCLLRSGVEEFHKQFAQATLIFQSTRVTKPEVNDLPFAAGGTEFEKVWLFFL